MPRPPLRRLRRRRLARWEDPAVRDRDRVQDPDPQRCRPEVRARPDPGRSERSSSASTPSPETSRRSTPSSTASSPAGWNRSSSSSAPPARHPATAAAFASSQATKWKGRVRLYEFTNEPDLHGWTGTNYAKALIPAYNAIKAADPKAIVIAGALWTGAGGPVKFVTDMYNAGAKGHFDVLSLHLYDDPFAAGTWNIWNMAFHTSPSVRSVMDAHGDQSIPIGATEAGGPVNKYGEADKRRSSTTTSTHYQTTHASPSSASTR